MVMRTVSCIIGGSFTWASTRQCLRLKQPARRLFTNSAINRGIRRGKSSSFGGEGRSQVNRGDRSGREGSILLSRREGGFQIDRSDRSGWKGNNFRENGSSQGSRAESSIRRRDGRSEVDRGDRLRGKSSFGRRDDRLQSHRDDRSGQERSFFTRDGRSPIDHGERWERQSSILNISKRPNRGDGYSRNGTGTKSMSQDHAETQFGTRQDGRKLDSFGSSGYSYKKNLGQGPRKTDKWMGRGRVANRTVYANVQLSGDHDNTLDGKSPGSSLEDKDYWLSSRTRKELYPMRHRVTEELKTGHRSHQPLEAGDSVEEEELAINGANLRNRKPALSLPYTTPASEFLYGTSVVSSALKSKRRKLYKLYAHEGSAHYGGLASSQEVTDRLANARKLALAAGVEVVSVKTDSLPLMDKMSDGRPHNVRCELVPS